PLLGLVGGDDPARGGGPPRWAHPRRGGRRRGGPARRPGGRDRAPRRPRLTARPPDAGPGAARGDNGRVNPPERYDLAVIGGGPAGAAAAIRAARGGARVVVFEKGRHGRDKICGDGLTPRAVGALR